MRSIHSKSSAQGSGARLTGEGINEMILVVLGIVSLLLSGLLLAMKWGDDHSSAWFRGLLDPFWVLGSAVFAVIGQCLLLYGLYQLREARKMREFYEELEAANRPRESK
jgi:hypothetical protein